MENLAPDGATAAFDDLQGVISASFEATRDEIRGQIANEVEVVQ